MRTIEIGDVIRIEWCNGAALNKATVVSMPQATGDLLYVKTAEGKTIGINTGSSNFDKMLLIEKQKDEIPF